MSRAMRVFNADGVVDPKAVELGDTILQVCVQLCVCAQAASFLTWSGGA